MFRGMVITLFIFFAVPTGCRQTNPSLLSRASRIVASNDWDEPFYAWLSDQNIIAWQGPFGSSKAIQIDVTSGKQTPLLAFNKRFSKRMLQDRLSGGQLLYGFAGHMRLSPDGKQVLWVEGPFVGPAVRWRVLSLDGSHSVEGPLEPRYFESAGAWTRDGRGWVSLCGSNLAATALHHDLTRPNTIREVRIGNFSFAPTTESVDIPPLLGFTAQGTAVVAVWQPEQTTDVDVYELDVDTGTRPPHKHTIHIPQDARVDEVALSPQSDRLAWLFYFDRSTPNDPTGVTDELWVSRLDGSDLRPVGSEQVRRPKNGEEYTEDFLHTIRWAPDGKRLSFIHKDVLWVVPVD